MQGHACQIVEPQQANPHGYTVIFLHDDDLRGIADWSALQRLCNQAGLRVVSPLAGVSWWTDRLCSAFSAELSPEEFVVQHVTAFVENTWGVQAPRMALLGVGMGGQGALRLAFKHPDLFPITAALSPDVDYHLRLRGGDAALGQMYSDEEQARQDTAILHIHPLYYPRNIFFCCNPQDTMRYDGVERLAMKLGSLGVPYECDLETVVRDSTVNYNEQLAKQAVTYLMQRFDTERLRIV